MFLQVLTIPEEIGNAQSHHSCNTSCYHCVHVALVHVFSVPRVICTCSLSQFTCYRSVTWAIVFEYHATSLATGQVERATILPYRSTAIFNHDGASRN